jgi:hypothetical protein
VIDFEEFLKNQSCPGSDSIVPSSITSASSYLVDGPLSRTLPVTISAEFQFDVVNIDDKSMRKLVDTDSINTACLCLCCHSIKMCRKYTSGLHIPPQVQDTEIAV